MTIASSINKHIYQGNGATTQWPFTFKIFDESNIQIYLTDPSGAETKLDTGYRVDKQNGYVKYPYPSGTPLPSGWKITLFRVVPIVQETDLVNQGPFFAEVIEDAIDKLTVIDQQQEEKLERTMRLPVSAPMDVSVELPTPMPLKTFRWDATGKKLELTDDPQVFANSAAASAGQAVAAASAAQNAANAAAASASVAQNAASIALAHASGVDTVTVNPVVGIKTVTALAASQIFAGASVLSNRKKMVVRNTDQAIRIRIGPSSISQISGMTVEPGGVAEILFDGAISIPIYAISEGASVAVEVWES